MKKNTSIIRAAGSVAVCLVSFAQPSFSQSISMDFVTVGDAGNAADTTGYGGVSYDYRIGKHEVTNGQYATFLNAVAKSDPHGLYHQNHGMHNSGQPFFPTIYGIDRTGSSGNYSYAAAAGRADNPVAFVNWFDAARFVNWMHNGMGSGSTESGVYDMSQTGTARMTAASNALFRIPSPDEWYKAAYYDPTKGGTGGYWTYATQSDTAPTYGAPGNGSNLANIAPGPGGSALDPKVHAVGSYTNNASYYGTFDQNGNLYEWVNQTTDGGDAFAKGSSWAFGSQDASKTNFAGAGQYTLAGGENDHNGFRIMAVGVPEPSSLSMVGLAFAIGLFRRRV